MNGFALAGVLTLQYPVLGPALVVLAASIGASRVVMGLHYPSDVAAGALLGLAIGGLAYAAILG
jgi:undecaprenyl-diphosphatase